MNQEIDKHLPFMNEALKLAEQAAKEGEVPVGAVIVYESQIIAHGFNLRESRKNPLAHAELIAIEQAAQKLGRWRLHGCSIYVTLEPCAMCAGALVNARIDKLIFGTTDPKAGAIISHFNIGSGAPLNHTLKIESGIMQIECQSILQIFFKKRRQDNKALKNKPHQL